MAVLVLAAGALPMAFGWFEARNFAAPVQENASVPPSQTDPASFTPNEIDVQLKPGADDATLAELSKEIGASFAWNSPVSRSETDVADVVVPAGTDEAADLAILRADPRVEAADIDHIYSEPAGEMDGAPSQAAVTPGAEDNSGWKPNDPLYSEQWNFKMVNAETAWDITRGKGAIVAVIDTGVAYKDTDKGKRAKDFEDTQFVDGYDFVTHDAMPNDDQGHGTHVAGTIAESTNNGEGVAGLAFEAKIMPLKVLSSTGSGSTRDIAEAIRWAADHGANVINMSLGGPYPDQVMGSACEYAHKKGVTIVCAAGNSFREGVGYPAAYKDCIAVSAVGPKGELSYYSSWGKQLAIAAPGGDKDIGGDAGGILQNTIFSHEVGGTPVDDYFSFQGTSMASPHVAAVAALIVSQGVKNPDDVKAVLQKSARKKGPANKYGAGILDAGAAAKLAANTYSDGVSRFWMVVALFAGCMLIGRSRARAHVANAYPFWGTAALSFGLLFPDWLTGFIGATSPYNLIGHSILIPGILLLMGAQKGERRLLGWMALGLTAHLGWEFMRGTSPFGPEVGSLQLLPWVVSNVCVGLGILVAGLSAPKD
jgi:serine protease